MRTIVGAYAIVHLLVLAPPRALAHGESAWIGELGLTNERGELCCGEHDCHVIPWDSVRAHPGGYQVPNPLGEGVLFVPSTETLPSRDGKFHLCLWGGARKCFFAPPMGS